MRTATLPSGSCQMYRPLLLELHRRFNDARLHAVLLMNTYSLHGFVEWINSVPFVCHFWISAVVLDARVAADPRAFRDLVQQCRRTSFFCNGFSPVTVRVHHFPCPPGPFKNSSLARTERFSFWYITLP